MFDRGSLRAITSSYSFVFMKKSKRFALFKMYFAALKRKLNPVKPKEGSER